MVNGPATFQSFMNDLLGDTPNILVYLYDILINSHNRKELESGLKRVLRVLKENKCEFFKDTLDFLGHTITPNEIEPNDLKIETIVK